MSRHAWIVAGVALAIGLAALIALGTRRTPPRPGEANTAPTTTTSDAHGDAAVAAPHTARDGGAAAHGRAVITVPWGSGAGQLGRRANPESLAEGPMSLVVDAHGVVILDTVNRRVARFDTRGRALPPIALDSEAAQDLTRTRNGVAVLDRLHDKRVTVYDATVLPSAS
jgi:hypothetical protein